METKTARDRSTETRPSGAVDWLVSQFTATRFKLEGKKGARHDRTEAWSTPMTGGSKVTVMKKTVRLREQSELWPAADQHMAPAPTARTEEAAPAKQTVRQETPVGEVPFLQVKNLREPVPRFSASPTRKTASATPRCREPGPVRPIAAAERKIARFLNVNGAIEGMKNGDGIRFDLPGRSLTQALRLWQGTTETATYSMAP
jgi:hypothetical protein